MLPNSQMETILTQVKQLSPEYRLRLIQDILQTLISPAPTLQPQPIQFGEFEGDESSMSTLEDFAVAQWHPTDNVY